MDTDTKQTVDVPTAGRMLGISRTTAFKLAREGKLPGAFRLGGRILVSRRVLERVLDGEKVEAVP